MNLPDRQANMIRVSGIHCPGCDSRFSNASIAVQLDNCIRDHISRYYLGWTVCDGDGCGSRTRMMSVYGKRCMGIEKPGCKGSVKLEVGLLCNLRPR
jgi:DNA polymerase alpha subunit A